MVTKRRRRESRVFFPWERRRGPLGVLGRARLKLFTVVLVVGALVVALWKREEHLAEVRATRATLTSAARAVTAFRADHGGACPRQLAELVTGGYAGDVPSDAWGRALRLACPSRRDLRGFDLSSDGPDGEPGGLDRVE